MAIQLKCGIYKITSPTGRIYIGQSVNIQKRKSSYRCGDCKKQKALYASIMKYGFINHFHEIIEELPKDIDILNEREFYWIDYYKCNKIKYPEHRGLNLTDGGDGSKGGVWSEERRSKLVGRKRTTEQKARIKEGIRLYYLSKDRTIKRKPNKKSERDYQLTTLRMLGNKHSLGFKHTKETIEKMKRRKEKNKILDLQTGIFYDSIKEVCLVKNYNYDKFRRDVVKNSGGDILQLNIN